MEKESRIPREISVSTTQSAISRDFNDEFTIIAIEDCMSLPSLTSKFHQKMLRPKRALSGNKSTLKSVELGSVITEEGLTATSAGNETRDCVRIKYLAIALSIFLSTVALAVVVWVGVAVAKGHQQTESSTNNGSSSLETIYNPNSSPDRDRYTQMYDRVREISDSNDLQENSNTPQRSALEWLVSGDPTGVMPSDDTLLLRYALTVLFYALHGSDWYVNDKWLEDSNLCVWNGVDCSANTSYDSSTGTTTSKYEITGLSLGNMNLAGAIPKEVFYISSLQNIDFSQNRITGTIPSSLGLEVNLVTLNLSKNLISGSIPQTIGSLSQLDSLRLNDNMLEGGVLRALSNLYNIRVLRLEHNLLSGMVPTNICASSIPNKDLMVDSEVSCDCCTVSSSR